MSEEQASYETRSEELLNQLDSTAMQLGKLLSRQHGAMACCQGLTLQQTLALRVIADHGSIKMGEIATLIGVKAPAASSLVDSLEKSGYLQREHAVDDRRVWRIQLTEQGTQAVTEAERERRDYMRRFVPLLTHEEIETIIRIHRKLIDAMTSGEL
jgi:DNA-binding MarR family transcriptional regulator